MKDYLGIFHKIFREFFFQILLGKIEILLKYILIKKKDLKKYLTYI
jgi:hypothetical protein